MVMVLQCRCGWMAEARGVSPKGAEVRADRHEEQGKARAYRHDVNIWLGEEEEAGA